MEQAEEYGHSLEREICYKVCTACCTCWATTTWKRTRKRVMRAREKAIMGDD